MKLLRRALFELLAAALLALLLLAPTFSQAASLQLTDGLGRPQPGASGDPADVAALEMLVQNPEEYDPSALANDAPTQTGPVDESTMTLVSPSARVAESIDKNVHADPVLIYPKKWVPRVHHYEEQLNRVPVFEYQETDVDPAADAAH